MNLFAVKPLERILAESEMTGEHSLKRSLGPAALIAGIKLAGLAPEILQDRSRLENRDGLAARAIRDLGEEAGRMVLTDPDRYTPERYEAFVRSVLALLLRGAELSSAIDR